MKWTRDFAYVVGLIATDGNLSKDGRHITFVSKDIEQISNFKSILNLDNKIGLHSSGFPKKGQTYYRIQFGNTQFYKFLLNIGLHPNKSKTLPGLNIPDKYFIDFLRGDLDGDGYTYSYWDKRWKSSFMLYTGFTSASEDHLVWIKNKIEELYGILGTVRYSGKSIYQLKYAKTSSIMLLNEIYYRSDLPCLKRKRLKIERALGIIDTQAGVLKLADIFA